MKEKQNLIDRSINYVSYKAIFLPFILIIACIYMLANTPWEEKPNFENHTGRLIRYEIDGYNRYIAIREPSSKYKIGYDDHHYGFEKKERKKLESVLPEAFFKEKEIEIWVNANTGIISNLSIDGEIIIDYEPKSWWGRTWIYWVVIIVSFPLTLFVGKAFKQVQEANKNRKTTSSDMVDSLILIIIILILIGAGIAVWVNFFL